MRKKRTLSAKSLLLRTAGTLLAGYVGGCMVSEAIGHSQGIAERRAGEFARSLGLVEPKVTCVRLSTASGYTPCTIAHRQGEQVRLEPIECAGGFAINDGCRLQKIKAVEK